MTITKDDEVRQNFDAFQNLLPDLVATHPGKFALLRHSKVVEFFDTPRDALIHGQSTYDDNLFSIQEVTERAVDLGWFSHAPTDAAV